MGKRFGCFLAAFLAVAAVPAWAGNACYSPVQMQAEQWLRLHSELMVITVTCRQGAEGQDLPAAYGAFTKKNLPTLHDAEQTMIAYYQKTGKGDPVEKLDHLRTLLGNEFGKRVADMSAPNFCDVYRNKVVQLSGAALPDVETQVQKMEAAGRSYAPVCGAGRAVASNKRGG